MNTTFNNGYDFAKLIATGIFYLILGILTALGVSTLCSCTATKSATSTGKTTVVTTDTTHIEHGGTFNFKIKL